MNDFVYKLMRYSSGGVSTLGILMTEQNEFKCFTLEDEYRKVKVADHTRIPAGTYEIKLRKDGGMNRKYATKYPYHKGMLWLQDVPDFSWIYIHVGNLHSHSSGCILVGDGATQNISGSGSVTKSVKAYERVYKEIAQKLETDKVFIDVWDFA